MVMLILLTLGLWAAKMNLNGTSALATDEDLAHYERKLESLEIELERRKDLGRQFEAILNRQERLMQEDAKGREEHQVSFLVDFIISYNLLVFFVRFFFN